MAFFWLFFLAISGCGYGNPSEVKAEAGGYSTPDAAFDAMITAIKTDDIKTYKECWSANPEHTKNIEKLFRQATTPPEMSSWENLFKLWRVDIWADGNFKRYPSEIKGDKASITCAFTSARYARYEYKKVDAKWYITNHVVLSSKTLDPKYLWKEGAFK